MNMAGPCDRSQRSADAARASPDDATRRARTRAENIPASPWLDFFLDNEGRVLYGSAARHSTIRFPQIGGIMRPLLSRRLLLLAALLALVSTARCGGGGGGGGNTSATRAPAVSNLQVRATGNQAAGRPIPLNVTATVSDLDNNLVGGRGEIDRATAQKVIRAAQLASAPISPSNLAGDQLNINLSVTGLPVGPNALVFRVIDALGNPSNDVPFTLTDRRAPDDEPPSEDVYGSSC
jgi:hypothetical protein